MSRTSTLSIYALIVISFFIYIPLHPAYALEPVIIDSSLTSRVIGTNIEYFEDTTKKLSFDEIVDNKKAVTIHWTASVVDKPGFGFKEAVYWTRFTLKNPTKKDIEFYLHQEYPHIDKLSLYVPDQKGKYSVIKTGAAYPFAQRPYEYKNFVFPLNIKAGATETLYLRLDSHGSINIHLSVASPVTFEENKDSEAIFNWMFYGIFTVMFIFNLFIFLATRDWSYFYYILYIASFGLFTMSLDGMGFQYLWPRHVWIGKLPIAITMAIIQISIIQFALYFINVRKLSIFWYRILRATVVLALVLLIVTLAVRNYWFSINATNILSGIAAFLGILSITYLVLFKKSRQGIFFLGSFVFFLLGVIMVVLYHRGVLPATPLVVNGIYIGAVFQVITLSLGLADRISIMKNELKDLNRELEKKVSDRTDNLRAANEEMTAMNQNLLKARDALWGEMQLAKKIQTVLLPEKPSIQGYELSVYMKQADDVGGDYYDIINAAGTDWIFIGDVSGHGVPAGLIMMMAQTSINTIIEDQPRLSPSEVLIKVNRTIYRNIRKLGDDKYMTITALAAHKDGNFTFSGLHQDIMIHRKKENDIELLDTCGMWIGINEDMEGQIADNTFCISEGDTMLLYTDGITEALARDYDEEKARAGIEMFGATRLREIFWRTAGSSLDVIKNKIINELENFVCHDDVTLVIIRRVA